ncbi:cytochrome c4 [Candidatus Photodesmus katoptron]|uniref:Cytochrome c4 n=1 Tax=Candidatus Photodesmus katoptron Akat1 TaxID=1236703 RepID=S3EIK5_9GAMM|nr:c-type cytochrome [Candidatus Photodesmus katoptron]EPE38023.1 cytochrome c4 [Candidatus Photodesmus katoptron Akat1]KEY90760.1 cytochrome c4 [Candidatus Photodesmus katoptron]
MKKLSLILTLLISFDTWTKGNIEAGKSKSLICSTCHGSDGNSQLAIHPNLAGQNFKYIEKQLKDYKLSTLSSGKEGRFDPVMEEMMRTLNDEDIKDLAAYYSSLPISESTTPLSVVDSGKKIYTFGNMKRKLVACIACHGPRGNGIKLAGFPKISGQNAEYIKIQLEKFRDGSRKNNVMMNDIAKILTDEEIEILSKYLGGLH